MAHFETQNILNNDPIINVTVSESLPFSVHEVEVLSSSLSTSSFPSTNLSDGGGLPNANGEDSGTPNRLTAELLGTSSQPATFDFNDWGWNTATGAGPSPIINITPRQRTLSLHTILSHPLAVTLLRPIPATVPETLPSLYAPSQTADEDYDDEDDATEADSIFFCNNRAAQEARIRTTTPIPSIVSRGINTPEIGFDAPEAFADFDDLGIIVAALRLTAEESPAPTNELMGVDI